MTCKINADTTDGLKIVSDTSGEIEIQDNGTTRVTVGDNVGVGTSSNLTAKINLPESDYGEGINILSSGTEANRCGIGHYAYETRVYYGGSDNLTFVDGGPSGTEKARINADGELCLGTTTNTANTTLVVQANNGVNSGIGVQTDNTGSNAAMYFMNPNGIIGSIVTSGSATAFNTSSDYRLKENVTYTFDATTRLKQLKPARFNFKADSDLTVDGFLAHEVSSIVPEAITGVKDAKDEDDKPIYQSIDQSKLVPLLVKTIQELEARITALES